jgi:hypothetical protein
MISISVSVSVTLWNCDDIGREKRQEKSQNPHFVDYLLVYDLDGKMERKRACNFQSRRSERKEKEEREEEKSVLYSLNTILQKPPQLISHVHQVCHSRNSSCPIGF